MMLKQCKIKSSNIYGYQLILQQRLYMLTVITSIYLILFDKLFRY